MRKFYPAVLIIAAMVLSGCQGAGNGSLVRRAQVIVDENAKLKKQLDDRDTQIIAIKQEQDKQIGQMKQKYEKQIAELNSQIEQMSPEFLEKQQQDIAQLNTQILQMLADCEKRLSGEPNQPSAEAAVIP